METKKSKFEDFKYETLSKKQQKTVRGGDDDTEAVDPNRGHGKGNL